MRDGGNEQIARTMERLRNEGKMELRANPETGEMEGKLTDEGMAEARVMWRRILEVPDETTDEELDIQIGLAYIQLMKEGRVEGDDAEG